MLISSASDVTTAMLNIRSNEETKNPLLAAVNAFKNHSEAVNVKISVVVTKIFNAKMAEVRLQGERHEVLAGECVSTTSSLTIPISALFYMKVLVNVDAANERLLSHIESKLETEQPFHLERIEFVTALVDENSNTLTSILGPDLDFNKPKQIPEFCVIS
jgi:hypothetical protein